MVEEMKIENVLKKCSEHWREPETEPLIQKITSIPKDWHLYDTMRDTIEWANEQGINVIPIKRRSKVPAIPSWKEYQEREATYKEIEQWFFSYLAEETFNFQFCTYMAHYLRHKLRQEWYNSEKEEWKDNVTPILHQEPWVYREWYKVLPNTAEEFYELLISKDFNQFLKEHVEKGHTWGWTKLFNKQKPMLLNLYVMLLQAQENTEQYKEALKTCQHLLGGVRHFWLAGYPEQLRKQVKNDTSIGDIAFTWVILNKDKDEKMSAIRLASMLNMNVVTCRRTIMPQMKKLETLLRVFDVDIAHRGEG